MNDIFDIQMNLNQKKVVADLITQHGGKITGISISITTDDGRNVVVHPSCYMKWLRRNEVNNYAVEFNGK